MAFLLTEWPVCRVLLKEMRTRQSGASGAPPASALPPATQR
eukprot:COSAG06_NODE_20674_length_785_cov_13.513120_1_plen_40_part_10